MSIRPELYFRRTSIDYEPDYSLPGAGAITEVMPTSSFHFCLPNSIKCYKGQDFTSARFHISNKTSGAGTPWQKGNENIDFFWSNA